MSYVYILNKKGEIRLACGAPAVIGLFDDLWPLILTHISLEFKYEANNAVREGGKLHFMSL